MFACFSFGKTSSQRCASMDLTQYAGMGVFVIIFLKETKGRSLEDMDILFGSIDAEQRKMDVEQKLAEEKGIDDKDDHHAQHAEHIVETQKK